MSRILIVDDAESNRQLLDYLLRHFGHETILADNGADAIEAALRERPDLAIIDLAMPGMRGEEVARRLRATPEVAHMPLLAISVGLDPQDHPDGGFDGWYPMPIDPEHLLQGIQRYLQDASAG
ncbi:MAG TPA: response regulator [Actinomycetes bacterium]|nr:response regulator [Actinomycetes bacterium]